jgi:hypothetical protein
MMVALLVPLAEPLSTQQRSTEGDEWLRWRRDARETYYMGYIFGLLKGYEEGCRQAGPEYRCTRPELDFTKGSDYFVTEITNFYKRYPNDRDIAPHEVLEQLAKGLTLEEIHEYPFWGRQRRDENR